MFVVIWEYQLRPGAEAAFQALYGRDGAWVALFRDFAGYRDTELLHDPSGARYLTIDRWASDADYNAFLDLAAARYATLDRQGDALTSAERCLGRFTAC